MTFVDGDDEATQRAFIKALTEVVVCPEDVEEELENPAPDNPATVVAASWYQRLGDDERHLLRTIIKKAEETAVFGVLCVLDGVRAWEGYGDKSEIDLFLRRGQQRVPLKSDHLPMLHDVFQWEIAETSEREAHS